MSWLNKNYITKIEEKLADQKRTTTEDETSVNDLDATVIRIRELLDDEDLLQKSALRSDDKIDNLNTQIRNLTTQPNTKEDRIIELELNVKNTANVIHQQEQY